MSKVETLQEKMASTRQLRARYAALEQQQFEEAYPVGALVEFKEHGKWIGPAVIIKNRIGPITSSHTSTAIVYEVNDNAEVIIKNTECIRLYGNRVSLLATAKTECLQ